MKKLKKSISIRIPSVTIFLEDIKEIEEVFKENCNLVKIHTESFELDSYTELQNIGEEKLNCLSFISYEPSIHLELGIYDAYIYSQSDDAVSTGIVNKLKEILDKKVNLIKYVSNYKLIVLLNALNLMLYVLNQRNQSLYFEVAEYANVLVIILLVFLSLKIKHSTIFVKNKNENKFLKNHKNQILLLIIGGCITLGVQILVQTFVQLWIKHL